MIDKKDLSSYRQGMKKLKDIPEANAKLYKEVAGRTSTSPKQVEECIKIVGSFIAATVKKGAFETVMIPGFGKFRAKTKKVQWSNHAKTLPKINK